MTDPNASPLSDRFEILGPAAGVSQTGKMLSYDARERATGESVVVCELKAVLARDELIRGAFESGVSRIQKLDHPGIIRVVGAAFGEAYGACAITRVQGGSISKLLRQGAIFIETEVVAIGRALLDAIGYAHAQGVVFGNIKPSNVVLHENRRQVVIVGLPKPPLELRSIRQIASYVGAIEACAPELLSDGHIDERTDIYGVGLLLYQLAVGHAAFVGTRNLADLTTAVIDEGVPAIMDELPDMAPRLAEVIMRAADRDPAARFQSAEEMAAMLQRAGARPVPLLAVSRLRDLVCGAFPAPVAQPYSTIDGAEDPQTQVHLVVDAAQIFVQFLAAIALSARIQAGSPPFVRDDGPTQLARPSLGHWSTFLREAVGSASALVPELGQVVRPVDALVPLRNEIRHGVSPSVGMARRRLLEYRPLLEQALGAARFLRKYLLFVPRSLDYRGGEYLCRSLCFRGVQSPPAVEVIHTGRPLTVGRVYLASASFDRIVDLHPLVLLTTCPVCDDEELFLYESAGDRRAHYMSSTRGHMLTSEEALEELEAAGLLARQ